jgi:hypothetical protein
MNRVFARLATVAVALPFAAGMVAGSAHAETVTVPGCFGAGSNDTIVCDVTVTGTRPSAHIGVAYVRVCAGECQDVPVQWVQPTTGADLCVDYKTGAGTPKRECASENLGVIVTPTLNPYVFDLLSCSGGSLLCAYEA